MRPLDLPLDRVPMHSDVQAAEAANVLVLKLSVLPSLQEGPGAGGVRRGHPPVRAVLPGR